MVLADQRHFWPVGSGTTSIFWATVLVQQRQLQPGFTMVPQIQAFKGSAVPIGFDLNNPRGWKKTSGRLIFIPCYDSSWLQNIWNLKGKKYLECSAIWEDDAKWIFRSWLTLHCSSKVQITSKSPNKKLSRRLHFLQSFPSRHDSGRAFVKLPWSQKHLTTRLKTHQDSQCQTDTYTKMIHNLI